VQTQFKSAVTFPGNRNALSVIERVFRPSDVKWRGLGAVPKSGLILRLEYKAFQAESAFDLAAIVAEENPQCVCGDIITGRGAPLGCALFGDKCSPENPLGPPMASPEGPCSAFHTYAGASARSAA
jgi:hydrogenase expression/formation protein HypD